MRISVDDRDVGFDEWRRLAGQGVDVFAIKVKQNGVLVTDALVADDDVHLTIRYKKDANGQLVMNWANDCIETEIVYGPVEIIMPVAP